jgi:hypothetical protein
LSASRNTRLSQPSAAAASRASTFAIICASSALVAAGSRPMAISGPFPSVMSANQASDAKMPLGVPTIMGGIRFPP